MQRRSGSVLGSKEAKKPRALHMFKLTSTSTDHLIRQAIDAAIDAFVLIDGDNNIIYFNDAAENLWGYTRDEVMGQNVKMLVPKQYQAGHDDLIERHRTTGQDRIVGSSRDQEVLPQGR